MLFRILRIPSLISKRSESSTEILKATLSWDDEISLSHLDNDFILPENKHGCQSLKRIFENAFDRFLRGFLRQAEAHNFKGGGGPGNEVDAAEL